MRKYYANIFMAPEDAGAAAGGTAAPAAGGEGQGAAGGSAAPAGAGAAGAPGGSALGNAAPQAQPHERFPEKFRVFKEDKSFDLEATALKQAEAYSGLEKRLGTGEAPPSTPDEYKVEKLGEGIDAAEVMKDPLTKSFLARAHAKGMTNAQVADVLDFALSEWMPQLLDGHDALNEQQCVTELRKVWSDDAAYTANMTAANKAWQAFADPSDVGRINEIGNNPMIVRMLANIGREMGEDRGVTLESVTGGKSLDELMQDPAYGDPKNPNHARVSEQVRKAYELKYGKNAVM